MHTHIDLCSRVCVDARVSVNPSSFHTSPSPGPKRGKLPLIRIIELNTLRQPSFSLPCLHFISRSFCISEIKDVFGYFIKIYLGKKVTCLSLLIILFLLLGFFSPLFVLFSFSSFFFNSFSSRL